MISKALILNLILPLVALSEPVVNERVGYLEGLLPALKFVQYQFDQAQDLILKNEAINTYYQFEMFFQSNRDRSPFISKTAENLVLGLIQEIRQLSSAETAIFRDLNQFLRPTPEAIDKIRENKKIYSNLNLNPNFEKIKEILNRYIKEIEIEVQDSRGVNKNSNTYLTSLERGHKFKMFYFKTFLYIKQISFPGASSIEELLLNVELMQLKLKSLLRYLGQNEFELSKLIKYYIESLDQMKKAKTIQEFNRAKAEIEKFYLTQHGLRCEGSVIKR